MKLTLIIPAAGKSSRFPTRPKFLLVNPNGKLMIEDCLSCIDFKNVKRICVGVLSEHLEKFCPDIDLGEILSGYGVPVTIIPLKEETSSPSETVIKIIEEANITGGIFIKDCDNCYSFVPEYGNFVVGLDTTKHKVTEMHNKSFLEMNYIGQLTNIVEKRVIGTIIGIGGYSFQDAFIFKEAYDILSIDCKKELLISHIIISLMLTGTVFSVQLSDKYYDWGTYEEWRRYCDLFGTYFCDIDGVLVYNSGEYGKKLWGSTDELKGNAKKIRELFKSGKNEIILTTSRKEKFKKITEKQLKELNIPYNRILYGLRHCKRVLINDYSKYTNPYPSAIAINLQRDSDILDDLIR